MIKKAIYLSLACTLWMQAAEVELETINVETKVDTEVIKDVHGEDIKSADLAEALFKQTKIKQGKGKRAQTDNKKLLINAYDIIYWFDSLLSDIARLAQKCNKDTIINIDYYDSLQQISNRLYLKKILQLSDSINKAYYEIQGQVNINLLLEKLLIDWNNCQK